MIRSVVKSFKVPGVEVVASRMSNDWLDTKKNLVILDAGPGWMSWLQFARWRIFLWAVPPRAGGSLFSRHATFDNKSNGFSMRITQKRIFRNLSTKSTTTWQRCTIYYRSTGYWNQLKIICNLVHTRPTQVHTHPMIKIYTSELPLVRSLMILGVYMYNDI